MAQAKKPIVKAVFFIAILSSDGVGLNRSLEDFGAMFKKFCWINPRELGVSVQCGGRTAPETMV